MCLFGNRELIHHAIWKIRKRLKITDIGIKSFFSGVRISETEHHIHLTQQALIDRIIASCNMGIRKPEKTPLQHKHSLYEERKEPSEDESKTMHQVPYKELLGSLLFCRRARDPTLPAACPCLESMQSRRDLHWEGHETLG